MSARKYPYPCANPVCRKPIEPDQPNSMDLYQTIADGIGRRSWTLCNPDCARQYLALCDLKARIEGCPNHAPRGNA